MKQEHLLKLVEPVIRALETTTSADIAQWQCPWRRSGGFARNASTGRAYTGVNSIYAMVDRFENPEHTPFYATRKQWQALGATINPKDERAEGLMLTFYKCTTKGEGDDAKALHYSAPFWVINSAYVTGWTPDPSWQVTQAVDAETEASMLASIGSLGVPIKHGGERAAYSPTSDVILMPDRQSFYTDAGYWGVLWHEAAHATGHADRLKRPGITMPVEFGSDRYAFEELIAELAAAMASAYYNIFTDIKPASLAYLASWAKTIREEPTTFTRAAAAAAKAVSYIHRA